MPANAVSVPPEHQLALEGRWLLALAVHHRGRFITLDGAVPVKAVSGARAGDVVRLV